MPQVPTPTDPCTKCGNDKWLGPKYLPATQIDTRDPRLGVVSVPEALAYSCGACGFQRTESVPGAFTPATS